MELKPVFVCGALRSGTTLFHLMLDSHDTMLNPGELDFFFDYVQLAKNARDYKSLLEKDRIFKRSGLVVDERAQTYQDVLSGFIDQMVVENKVLSINLHRNFDLALQYFPHALFIHLNRDPRDVSRSCIGMGWAGHVYFGVDPWIETEQSWDRLQKNLAADQYIEISYEGLIENPEDNLRQVCQFLKIDFLESMLGYHEHSTYSKPDKSLIFQWKSKLSQREAGLVELKSKPLMQARNYEITGKLDHPPGYWEYIRLKLQNRLFRYSFDIKCYGFSLFLCRKFDRVIKIEAFSSWVRNKTHAIDNANLK